MVVKPDLSFSLGPHTRHQQHGHTTTHHTTARPAAKVRLMWPCQRLPSLLMLLGLSRWCVWRGVWQVYSPLQVKIEECLRADRSLTALHVEVRQASPPHRQADNIRPRLAG